MSEKLTIASLLASKGERKLTQVYVHNAQEAAACEAAGIDMIVTWERSDIKAIAAAAPNTFLTAGLVYGGGIARARLGGRLEHSPYPAPGEADASLDALAAAHPELARVERYGHSGEGRPLRALRPLRRLPCSHRQPGRISPWPPGPAFRPFL